MHIRHLIRDAFSTWIVAFPLALLAIGFGLPWVLRVLEALFAVLDTIHGSH